MLRRPEPPLPPGPCLGLSLCRAGPLHYRASSQPCLEGPQERGADGVAEGKGVRGGDRGVEGGYKKKTARVVVGGWGKDRKIRA